MSVNLADAAAGYFVAQDRADRFRAEGDRFASSSLTSKGAESRYAQAAVWGDRAHVYSEFIVVSLANRAQDATRKAELLKEIGAFTDDRLHRNYHAAYERDR